MKTSYQVKEGLRKRPVRMIDLSMFNEVLGEQIPALPPDTVGQFKLGQLLRRKFGPGYRSHPMGGKIMEAFQRSVKMTRMMR